MKNSSDQSTFTAETAEKGTNNMNFGKFTPWNEWKDHLNGTEHYQFHFENGYGASVIRGPYSYGGPQGLYELAVLRKRRKYWEITYDTTLTNDVLGNLEVDDVVKALEDISHFADDYDLLHESFVDHDGNVVFVD